LIDFEDLGFAKSIDASVRLILTIHSIESYVL